MIEGQDSKKYPNGTIIADRYEITSFLAEGGMAQVYIATQRQINRNVAIKVLSPMFSMNANVVKRFFREAQVVGQLSHPNTVRIYDMGETPDRRLFIAMELLKGEELGERIKRGLVPPEEALQIVKQVAGSLMEAHQLGIIHRDLKPDNIFLTNLNVVKVLDFGIAKLKVDTEDGEEKRLTKAGTAPGTPEYMSPEQARGQDLDARSDLYSLGVVLYEMLCGHPPFEEATFLNTILKQVQEPPPPLPDFVPEILRKFVIDRLLPKDPKQRPDNAEMFIKEVDDLLLQLAGANRPAAVESDEQLDKAQAEIAALKAQLAMTQRELMRSGDAGDALQPPVAQQGAGKVAEAQSTMPGGGQVMPGQPMGAGNNVGVRQDAAHMSGVSGIVNLDAQPQIMMDGMSRSQMPAMPDQMGQSVPRPSRAQMPVMPDQMGQSVPRPSRAQMPVMPDQMGSVPRPSRAQMPVVPEQMGGVPRPSRAQMPVVPEQMGVPRPSRAQMTVVPDQMGGMAGQGYYAQQPQAPMGQAPMQQMPMGQGPVGYDQSSPGMQGGYYGQQAPMQQMPMGQGPAGYDQSSPGMQGGYYGQQAPMQQMPMGQGPMGYGGQPVQGGYYPQQPQAPMGQGPMGYGGQPVQGGYYPQQPQAPMGQAPMGQAPMGQTPMGYGGQPDPGSSQGPFQRTRQPLPPANDPMMQRTGSSGGGQATNEMSDMVRRHARDRAEQDYDVDATNRPIDTLTGRVASKSGPSMNGTPQSIFMMYAQPLSSKLGPQKIEDALYMAQGIWNASVLGRDAVKDLYATASDAPSLKKLIDAMLARKEKYFADERWQIDNMSVKIGKDGSLILDFDRIKP